MSACIKICFLDFCGNGEVQDSASWKCFLPVGSPASEFSKEMGSVMIEAEAVYQEKGRPVKSQKIPAVSCDLSPTSSSQLNLCVQPSPRAARTTYMQGLHQFGCDDLCDIAWVHFL
ncbi:hypothetical protein J6590_053791 [Homalodisca vitripennis]|nr:hypothetical protein J6590_053791 [Homalodisca vitripennis]